MSFIRFLLTAGILLFLLFHFPAMSQEHMDHTDMNEPEKMETPVTGTEESHSGHMEMEMEMAVPEGWRDENIEVSPPPLLTGKQMGKVNTINIPPLGYEMDGAEEYILRREK